MGRGADGRSQGQGLGPHQWGAQLGTDGCAVDQALALTPSVKASTTHHPGQHMHPGAQPYTPTPGCPDTHAHSAHAAPRSTRHRGAAAEASPSGGGGGASRGSLSLGVLAPEPAERGSWGGGCGGGHAWDESRDSPSRLPVSAGATRGVCLGRRAGRWRLRGKGGGRRQPSSAAAACVRARACAGSEHGAHRHGDKCRERRRREGSAGRTDSQGGARARRGPAARLTPCRLVCLSRTPAPSGALSGRASSPPPPRPPPAPPDPSRASAPSCPRPPPPAPRQPTCPGEPRPGWGVRLSAAPAPRKVGRRRLGAGGAPSHSRTSASRTRRAAQPRRPYLPQEPRAKEQEEPFREQPHLPGGERGGSGQAGAEGGGSGLAAGVAAGRRSGGGPRTEREERARRGGRGAGGGESWVGLGRRAGAGLRGAPIRAAPRAPPPARRGAPKVTFTPARPGTPPAQVRGERAADPGP